MRYLRRFRPSPAMVVASIALFVAIGGVAYAAVRIDTHNIRSGAVTRPKLHANAVTSQKVRDGTLRRRDLAFAVQSPPGFSFVLGPNQSGTVREHGFTLRTGADGSGACTFATLFASAPSRFEVVSENSGSSANSLGAGHTALGPSTPPNGGAVLTAVGNSETGVVVAYTNDGGKVAQFEYTLDSGPSGQCHFAGSAVGGS
jgi:hypothetical protein